MNISAENQLNEPDFYGFFSWGKKIRFKYLFRKRSRIDGLNYGHVKTTPAQEFNNLPLPLQKKTKLS